MTLKCALFGLESAAPTLPKIHYRLLSTHSHHHIKPPVIPKEAHCSLATSRVRSISSSAGCLSISMAAYGMGLYLEAHCGDDDPLKKLLADEKSCQETLENMIARYDPGNEDENYQRYATHAIGSEKDRLKELQERILKLEAEREHIARAREAALL